MMARTQISFDPEMLNRAHERARALGVSLAEYVRRLVSQDLGERRPSGDPRQVFDLGSSGGSDIAAGKDEMIGEAFSRGSDGR